MDKQDVINSLDRNGKIAIETMAGKKYKIEEVARDNDEQHLHILKPQEVTVLIDSIKEIDENDLNDPT
ncbi:hypothetical protein J3T65_11855 [Staphylococcus simiae]|uniref:hypothetical protein n=1 Tax=Staphylococcus simiae TaxID=308354 RepID=UPI001A96AA1E|nr:hypothetical protein [Staphylococcus simiae]MBO1200028.1 hypothetical protein [Staphylococcus simiae]MBO1202302.1 hypothetical protein [Staphylococcus simiae]MBO1204560.1 hypothetical protein [Staphylococcus simiae]MBO1212099.1 hypothetical protein [Staphylococcus simiae]MBO1230727.1 hypothetical protein [Staphylococcus simiae]